MVSDKVKKNILDIHYNRYLQYFNTSIIILFTYTIALTIGFITKQIEITNLMQMILVLIVTLIVVLSTTLLGVNFQRNMKDITEEIKKLDI